MRAVVTIFSFVAAMLVFGYVARMTTNESQTPTSVESDAADQEITVEPAEVPVTVMTIEGQPFKWDAEALSLSEQLQQQTNWLQSGAEIAAVDEDLVTEVRQYGHETPYPAEHNKTLDERGLLFAQRAKNSGTIVRRWDPNTKDMKTVLLLQGVRIEQCVVSANGDYCLVRESSGPDSSIDSVVYVSRDGSRAIATLRSNRDNPRLVLLPDNSVLMVGGKDASKQRVNTVERISADMTQLDVERLTDIPGPIRWGYSIVTMQDGRLMVVGGNTAQYKGCKAPECSDKTYILDAETGLWSDGPTLSKARASATASLLADGSVIVAGGWTSDRAGNARPSRSTERLKPGEDQFVEDARLPFAMAEHRALDPVDDAAASALLLDRGGNSLVAYDLELGEWRVAGGFSTFTKFRFGPFSDGDSHFFWVSDSGEQEWSRQAIRIRGYEPDNTHATTLHLYRGGTGVLAGDTGVPAMIVGGHVSNPYRLTAAVDSYTDAEGLQAHSPLETSRSDAQVFRMEGGAIAVAGGVSINQDTRDRDTMAPPIEFLRNVSTSEKWQTLASGHPRGTQYAQLDENVLVAISPGRAVERLEIGSAGAESPRVNRANLPPLPVHREGGTQPNDRLVASGMKDGRLIVAGGLSYEKRIAIYQESMEADDEYVGIGNLVPANTYEVFNPTSSLWSTSAPASERGGQVVITDDGRVVKLRIKAIGLGDDGEQDFTFLFELSHADEGVWSPLQTNEPPYMEAGSTRLLSVGNELFVAGLSEATIGKERKRVLWWLDSNRLVWELVWQERASSLDSRHQDVFARVVFANGRELLVPVGGN